MPGHQSSARPRVASIRKRSLRQVTQKSSRKKSRDVTPLRTEGSNGSIAARADVGLTLPSRDRKLRILIVEENGMWRQMLRHMLESKLNHVVVGEAEDAPSAWKHITSTDPDVVLMELRVGGVDMLEMVYKARGRGKHPAFVVVSDQCDEVSAHRIEKARLHGFIDRQAEMFDAVRHALREIADGRRYFSPTWLRLRNSRVSDPFSFDKILTKRQQQVLTLVAKLQSDDLIMRQLKISQCTLRGHRRTIARKFNIPVKDLARFAREKGFAT